MSAQHLELSQSKLQWQRREIGGINVITPLHYVYSMLPSSGDLISHKLYMSLNTSAVCWHTGFKTLLFPSSCVWSWRKWRAALTFWQEMCRTALGPPQTPVRPLLDVFSSLNSLDYLWNTSHICQNRSIEFKQMSEGQTARPQASTFFSLMRHFCVSACLGW